VRGCGGSGVRARVRTGRGEDGRGRVGGREAAAGPRRAPQARAGPNEGRLPVSKEERRLRASGSRPLNSGPACRRSLPKPLRSRACTEGVARLPGAVHLK
jgi:hypothetical protein